MQHLEIKRRSICLPTASGIRPASGLCEAPEPRTTMELDVDDDNNRAVSDRSDPSDPTNDKGIDQIQIDNTDRLLFDVIPRLALLLGAAVRQYTESLYESQSGDEEAAKGSQPEEYEIEAILDAKHGAFPGVRFQTISTRKWWVLMIH
jgi:hypothetical protein